MKIQAIITTALTASLLASCNMFSGDLPVAQRPINVKANDTFNQKNLAGFQAVTFRTSRKDGEFKDAYCELTGNGFEANFLTPAIVMVPNFGDRSGDMVVYCRYKEQPISNVVSVKKSRSIKLSPLTSGIATAVGGPLAGTAVGAITDIITPDQKTNFGYDNTITINFR